MSYEKLYQVGFAICTLFSLTMFSSNLEKIERVYSAKNEVKTSTGVLETKGDRKENIPKVKLEEISCPELYQSGNTIESPRIGVTFFFTKEEVQELYPHCKIGNLIQSSVSVAGNNIQKKTIEKSENTVKSAKNIEQVKSSEKSRTPKQIYEQVKHLGYREEPTIALISTCKGSSLRPDHCILVGLTLMYNEAGNQQNSKACVDRNNCFGINSGNKSYSSLDEGMENWVQKYNKYWYKAENAGFFYSKSGKVSPSRYCTSEDSSGSSIGCPTGLKIASDKWEKLHKIIY